MKIGALVVDDEPLARRRIRTLLRGEPDFEVLGECADGHTAIASIREKNPALVFLDVQMPEVDGFGVVEAVGVARMPPVVFVTAYDDYAIKAFEVHAFDYLLKPFDRQRFHETLDRVRSQFGRNPGDSAGAQLQKLLDNWRPPQKTERIIIRSAGRISFLRTDEIDWIDSAGNYVRLHAGKETHLVRQTMAAIEGRLNPALFLRIHRTTIVNIERIKELQPSFRGDYVVLLRDGTRLTLSRGYRNNLKEWMGSSA